MASPGYYSELLAPLVGKAGVVIALDPPQFVASPGARANWRQRIARHPNIVQLLQPLDAVALPEQSLDGILLHLAYHEAYWESPRYGLARMDPRSLARTLARALKPGGRLLVIDHVAAPGSDPRRSVDQYHRIDPVIVKADFASVGLKLVHESRVLRNASDRHDVSVFSPVVRGTTDRMVLMFKRQDRPRPDR